MSENHSPASQFYTGLVAELYESLAGEISRADDYTPFLERFGTPALELACGSGLPMLDLIDRGFAVEGLDSSADMLDLCWRRAAERGLAPQLHLAEMQSFQIPTRYRSIFLAGASFTLLTTDVDALNALDRIYQHLEPGGHALIPLEVENLDEIRAQLGHPRESVDREGNRLRVVMLELEVSEDRRNHALCLRYQRIPPTGKTISVERRWERRSWNPEQFRELLLAAQFEEAKFLSPTGGPAEIDGSVFVALVRKA